MCNHNYIKNCSSLPKAIGKKCPYPELYGNTRSKYLNDHVSDNYFELPVDKHGRCIFHSQDAEWKRKNDFTGHFLHLIKLLLLNQNKIKTFVESCLIIFMKNIL